MEKHNTGIAEFISKKAFEIAYALFRVSSRIPTRSFKEAFEEQGVLILKAATRGDREELQRATSASFYLAKLGGEINLISPTNSELICNELAEMNAAIIDPATAGLPDIDLQDIFREEFKPQAEQPDSEEESKSLEIPLGIRKTERVYEANADVSNSAKIRQSAILSKIRQSGNCRINEIESVLPDVSERTIRYDLQTLVEQGLIERVGVGPATTYQAPEEPFGFRRVDRAGFNDPTR